MLLAAMVATFYAASSSSGSASYSRLTPDGGQSLPPQIIVRVRGNGSSSAARSFREGTASTYEDELSDDDETSPDLEAQAVELADRLPRTRMTDSMLSNIGWLHCHNVEKEQRSKKKDELWLRNQRKIMSMLQEMFNMLRQQPIMPHTAPPPAPQPADQDEQIDLDDLGAHDAQDVIDRVRAEPYHFQLGTVAFVSAGLIGRQGFWLICQAWAYKQVNMICGFAHDTDNAAGFWEFYKELTFSVFGANTPEIDGINLRYSNVTDHAYRDCWNTNYEINLTQSITTEILNVMALFALWIWLTALFTRVWDVRMLPS